MLFFTVKNRSRGRFHCPSKSATFFPQNSKTFWMNANAIFYCEKSAPGPTSLSLKIKNFFLSKIKNILDERKFYFGKEKSRIFSTSFNCFNGMALVRFFPKNARRVSFAQSKNLRFAAKITVSQGEPQQFAFIFKNKEFPKSHC